MSSVDPRSVAIVGMAGRFPGADDVDEFWHLIREGKEGISDLTDEQLRAAGVDQTTAANPDYVKRAGVLNDVAGFDADFFGIGSRDAAVMDPQHRHFYECAWAALESAGHVPERFGGKIGVFGGCGPNRYLMNNLLTGQAPLDSMGWFLLRHTANDKDFLTTGVSYRLGLRGPSVNIQTAASTSLVAVHFAIQSLLSGECDLVLAGASTIEFPHGVGYLFREGEVLASDGHCRAFDAESSGTVFTSGVAVVALRRLADATADGDPILAVIRGSAINNDGADKDSYLAPSVDGHAACVRDALAIAAVDARTVTLLEAHGSGTRVGDPIEVAALTAAFRETTADTGFCWLSSTKPNIGHVDTAAGVAGLIKVVQAMRHRWLPPLAGHTAPNGLLNIDETPFRLSAVGARWDSDGTPRRAGVSSLGVGGTNAHVVVEEAPPVPRSDTVPGPHLLLISARTRSAADAAAERLAGHLAAEPCSLADVAHTLRVGRREFAHRRAVVVDSVDEAVAGLASDGPARCAIGEVSEASPGVILSFPGGGAQYPGMAAGLMGDRRFGVFGSVVQEAGDELRGLAGIDLRPLLAGGCADAQRSATFRTPRVALPATFIIEVALARQLIDWGIEPRALVGHSLGEYTAAHLAGVFDLSSALELVLARSELLERVSTAGAMGMIALGEEELAPRLGDDVSLAVVNAADECVVSGRADAVDELLADLDNSGIHTQRIPLRAAAHSHLLDPVLDQFSEIVCGVKLSEPTMPYVSNLTGTWITPEQATDPDAWARHLRGTVRFNEGLATALADGPAVVLEVGPGCTLTSYAQRHRPLAAVSTLRHVNDPTPDAVHLLRAMSRMWTIGVAADWDRIVTSGGRRRKLTLPTYPFQHRRYSIEQGEQRVAPDAADEGAADEGAPAVPAESGVTDGTLAFVKALWKDLLWVDGVGGVGEDSDFFELGGHSLIAARVVAAVRKQIGPRLPLTTLVEHPTAEKFAAAIDAALIRRLPSASSMGRLPSVLVPLRPAGTKRPFFVVHGAGGHVLNLQNFARSVPIGRPVWGLQAHGNEGVELPDSTIEQMAHRYLGAVRHVARSGPYLIGGYSGGGIIALEMARQAVAAGDRVDLVVLFDTYRPGSMNHTRIAKLRNLSRNIRDGYGLAATIGWIGDVVRNRLIWLGLAEDQAETDGMDLFEEFQHVVARYRFSRYPTDVLLLRAAPVRPTFAFDYSWPEVEGVVRDRKVAGTHRTIFAPEHVSSLAMLVANALDAAEQR
jgi:acyl transferase domain-containing protein/thioesterase domain-containing protein